MFPESDCKDALIIHGGALGDFVMTLRVVLTLRLSGATRVGFMGRTEFAVLARRGGVDEFIDLNTGGGHALFSDGARLPDELCHRLSTFTLVVDLLGGAESSLPQKLRRMGVRRVVTVDPRPRTDWPGHVSDQWLDDLRAAGLHTNAGPPRIELEREAVAAAREELRRMTGTSGRIALIHPGSGSARKCWPLESFLYLSDALAAEKWDSVFILGPVESEQFSIADLGRLRSAAPTVEGRALYALADLLAAADLFIGNDSGVAHLAAAVGAPTVAIFGPTQPGRWRPLGPRVAVVTGAGAIWPVPMDILAAIRTICGPASP
ncbi:MAG TPA: glycosyltransferase family 9 protein [Phycisphaerae bacterium]|nr:glycosyltransferase family 9 protein [Phycisphaerae bacterium]